jgi:AraC-like DNA-binding protein
VDSRLLRTLPFEEFAIDHLVDHRKRYHLEFDPAFPFAIKVYSLDSASGPFPLNWHERLELFIPLSGSGEFVNGDHRTAFDAGDVLVIDTMKLHGLADFRGRKRRAMVVTFMPEFVYTLGAPMCDSVFLTPFYRAAGQPPAIVSNSDPLAPALEEALSRLAQCYFMTSDLLQRQAGCKAFLLQVLYFLVARTGTGESTRSEYLRRQEQSQQLGRLHEYLLERFDQKVSIAQAASIAGMSESRFMRYFRTVTGETFVAYLNRLRLERAAQLLDEGDLSIADIAMAVGFSDQSYFDRLFRRHFGRTPSEVRRGREEAAGARRLVRVR